MKHKVDPQRVWYVVAAVVTVILIGIVGQCEYLEQPIELPPLEQTSK